MQECDAGVCYGFFIFLNPPSKNFAKGQLVHTLQILGNQTVVCVGILRSCMYHQHTPCLPVYVSKCHTVLKIFCNTLTWTHDIATFLFYDALQVAAQAARELQDPPVFYLLQQSKNLQCPCSSTPAHVHVTKA